MVLASPNLTPGTGIGIGIKCSTIFKIIPTAKNKASLVIFLMINELL
jgi:hypothetical protein